MKKIVLLVILGVLAWWYFDGSRRMSEDQIRAYYAEEVRIMNDLDKERLCLAMSDDYRLEDLSHTPQGPVRMALDKEQACTVAGAAVDMFSQLRAMSNGMLAPTIKHEIAWPVQRETDPARRQDQNAGRQFGILELRRLIASIGASSRAGARTLSGI